MTCLPIQHLSRSSHSLRTSAPKIFLIPTALVSSLYLVTSTLIVQVLPQVLPESIQLVQNSTTLCLCTQSASSLALGE